MRPAANTSQVIALARCLLRSNASAISSAKLLAIKKGISCQISRAKQGWRLPRPKLQRSSATNRLDLRGGFALSLTHTSSSSTLSACLLLIRQSHPNDAGSWDNLAFCRVCLSLLCRIVSSGADQSGDRSCRPDRVVRSLVALPPSGGLVALRQMFVRPSHGVNCPAGGEE
jgi:hypothetical protein